MYRYSVFGLAVDSEIELPELAATDGKPDVTIRLGTVPRIRRHKATPYEEYVYTEDAGLFCIRNGNEVFVDMKPASTCGAVRVLLLGRVMAFLLRQRGWLPLHSSGVAIGGRAVLFVGPSGAGKSTTAAAFHACGHPVITDDVGALRINHGVCFVQPAWARIRLLGDSRGLLEYLPLRSEFQWDKHSIELGRPGLSKPLPVGRIYVLETGPVIRTERLRPVLAAAILSNHSFVKRHRSESEVLEAHLGRCAAVAGAVPVYRLVRPLSLRLVSEMVRFVEADLSDEPNQ